MTSRRAQETNDIGVKQRLRQALAGLKAIDGSPMPTAKALCDLANVSRNALYRYHPDVLLELYRLQQRRKRPGDSPAATADLKRLRHDNAELRAQVTMIAALVDHYFAAWTECRELLERRDREIANLRRSATRNVVSITRK